MTDRKIKLNFHANSAGTHKGAWRTPYGRTDGEFGIEYYHDLAKIAERGLFDAISFCRYGSAFMGGAVAPILF